MAYVSERIVNIRKLEEIISSAYTMNQLLVKELSKTAPDMEKVKDLSEAVDRELCRANSFEFCIERRKTI